MTTVRSTVAALLFAALGAGCAIIPADTPSDTLIGEWTVEDVDRTGVVDNSNLTVAFDETGRIAGSAGCNRYTGAYSYDAAASTLKVTPLGVTRRFCIAEALMTQERRFVTSLQAATQVEPQADGAIALTSPDGRVLLRRRGPVKPVATAAAAAAPATPASEPLPPAAATSTVSPAALPPPSTSSYALSGAPTAPQVSPVTPAPTPMSPVTPAGAPIRLATPAATLAAPVAPDASRRITASGEVYFLERIALPPDATVRVQLRDVSRVGAPATVLGEQTFAATAGPPFPFSVSAPVSVIAPNARLSLFAQILSGNRLLFITDTSNPVPVDGTTTPLRIRVVNAAPTPTRPTTQPAVAPPATTAPAVIAPSPLPPTPAEIPGAVAYRCNSETFKLAFQDQVAFLTTADGAVARLTRINASDDPGAPRMYSNSILTLIKEPESGGRVRFARGRMALTTCAKAD